MTIQDIALSQLERSPLNVRTASDPARVKQFAASIEAHGILENLTAHPTEEGKFGVVIGGTRLAALQLLLKQKKITSDYAVPCSVREANDPMLTEISRGPFVRIRSVWIDGRRARAAEHVQRIVGAQGMEALMARKPPVPEIPPVPSRRSGRGAVASRLAPARTAPPKQSQQPELPDLMEAFWGDGASPSGALGTRRARGRRGASPDPA
jgi:hypothetical protein